MKKRFRLSSTLSGSECTERCAALLGEEGVKFQQDGQSLKSTSTPIVFVNVDRRLYSRNNWVGLNPFVFVSGIDVNVSAADSDGSTVIDVVINQRRTLAICGLIVGLVLVVARALPANGLMFFVVASLLLVLLFRFFAGSLLRQEFERRLQG